MKNFSSPLRRSVLLLAGVSLAMAGFFAAECQTYAQTFDLESSAATFNSPPDTARPGALTSLSLTNSGLTMAISRVGGVAFDIVNNSGAQTGKPSAFGNRSLDPFFSPGAGTGFIANFSLTLSSFALAFGDYGSDADTLTLSAYSGLNGTGSLLATTTVDYSTGAFPTFASALVLASGIRSVTWSGTSNATGFDNSVFYDNFVARLDAGPSGSVPDTGSSILLLALGAVGLFAAHRVGGRKLAAVRL